MAGHDPQDATSVAAPVGELESACDRSIQGLKIGYLEEEAGVEPGVTGAIRKAADVLKEAGAELLPVRIPSLKKALACYCVLAPAEASANLARFEGVRYGFRATGTDYAGLYPKTRGQGFGREVQRRILLGTFALSSGYSDKFYLKAQEVRKEITTALYSALQNVDLLLGPTSPTTAFPLGARTADPLSMYLADLFTIPASLAGLPAISVPAGCSEGLPVGAQLTGRYLEEATVFSAAAVLEAAKL
jgi:aspartyl-tRNA(Asn)/glutamyl-tRNA(Gln) amidotransferase subunit A